jgi:protein gp37
MGKTKIEWATDSWNPITGCTPVSEGCQNCYARRGAQRLRGRFGYPEDEPFRPGNWRGDYVAPSKGYPVIEDPLHWREPRVVFVCSMGDLFHEDVAFGDQYAVFDAMRVAKQHTFLILTKRPERMEEFVDTWSLAHDWPLPNVWLGITAENQRRADERIPILLSIPATVHFVSCEPLLGPIDLARWLPRNPPLFSDRNQGKLGIPYKLDWVIVGGETGPNARPMHPDWARLLRDQCKAAGVPFFFKQWGEWLSPRQNLGRPTPTHFVHAETGEVISVIQWLDRGGHDKGWEPVARAGRKAAGRRLDGREWDEMPTVG